MQRLAEKFLSIEERLEVTKAVQAAEKGTSGEIVPMVVSASHSYPMATATGGALLALPLALLGAAVAGSEFWIGSQNMWLFLAFFALLYFPLRAVVTRCVGLKRFFLRGDQVEEEVREAAIASFYTEGLYRTREENGILIFISVLERRVWVLADKGINDKIDPGEWTAVVDTVTSGIKDNNQCQALCQAVTRVGEILQSHFPIRKDDRDELHNLIIR